MSVQNHASKIVMVAADKLKPYAKNARKHSEPQIEALALVIQDSGFTTPLLIDEKFNVIAGHGRLLAGKKIGMTEFPCIPLSKLSKAQIKALRLSDNALAARSTWDADLVRIEVDELTREGFDLSLLGFDGAELASLILGEESENAPRGDADIYSQKIDGLIYSPKGETYRASDLYDNAKAETLTAAISSADLPEDVRRFLIHAAQRHTVFNFHRIAEFYANAPAATQRLMEDSALVIIDFDRAIENGFVSLTDKLGALASAE